MSGPGTLKIQVNNCWLCAGEGPRVWVSRRRQNGRRGETYYFSECPAFHAIQTSDGRVRHFFFVLKCPRRRGPGNLILAGFPETMSRDISQGPPVACIPSLGCARNCAQPELLGSHLPSSSSTGPCIAGVFLQLVPQYFREHSAINHHQRNECV